MPLSQKDVEHIANLAHVELSVAEKERAATELSSVLDYVGKLSSLETAGGVYEYPVEGLSNVMDADEVRACDDAIREKLIAAFPDRAGDFLKVRSVFGE